MRKFAFLSALLVLFPLLAMAEDMPKVEVFGGYQYLHTGDITVGGGTLPSQSHNGWDAAVRANLSKHFGVEGDFGGVYSTVQGVNWHTYTYSGGPVVFFDAAGKINPFAHVLFGGIHTSLSQSGASVSKTGFTTLFGGGVDASFNRRISFRVIEADWVYYHYGDFQPLTGNSFSQSNNVRITTGIVFRF